MSYKDYTFVFSNMFQIRLGSNLEMAILAKPCTIELIKKLILDIQYKDGIEKHIPGVLEK